MYRFSRMVSGQFFYFCSKKRNGERSQDKLEKKKPPTLYDTNHCTQYIYSGDCVWVHYN